MLTQILKDKRKVAHVAAWIKSGNFTTATLPTNKEELFFKKKKVRMKWRKKFFRSLADNSTKLDENLEKWREQKESKGGEEEWTSGILWGS